MRLSIRNVGKLYQGRVRALDDFSLDVEPGVLGLLGPNGAGKSTLMKILATFTRPTSGTVTWNGEDTLARPDPVTSNTSRLFEALYVAMWYLGPLNRVPALDYMGATGNATQPGLWLVLAAGGILLAVLARVRRIAFTN